MCSWHPSVKKIKTLPIFSKAAFGEKGWGGVFLYEDLYGEKGWTIFNATGEF
jgi:hypothetical protein